ncbi:MAG: hypothetical protein HYV42_00145 [Candidatus Magasanikbacteria bacterium]|nr:hypothetical protein [Candidatus Magasanikbacteria bacterium]
MLNAKYFQKLRAGMLAYAEQRREVIKNAGDAEHLAKRAIFALQRGNIAEAGKYLPQAEHLLQSLARKFRATLKLLDEGSYRAAQEEYAEARLFAQFLANAPFGPITGLTIAPDIYLAGLCDVPGELARYATRAATEGNVAEVERSYQAAEAAVGELLAMNLTGYHRQKLDQAKQALYRLQQLVYETRQQASG